MLKIAYCSNVHAGANLEETRANLRTYAAAVKTHFSPSAPMGVGLWLSAQTAQEVLASPDGVAVFRDFLQQEGIEPFTFNGFPFGDFHQEVVKHDVYHPTWFETERSDYTWNLVQLIHAFAPPGHASISTLPLCWGSPRAAAADLARAAEQLGQLASRLAQFEQETGRLVTLCIEPEPGCEIQLSTDVVDFFERHLLPAADEEHARRHIRVCHDVCHGVVMGEQQRDVLETYQRAGILIGKVQISSAVVVDFDAIEVETRRQALEQLQGFAEDRYLHQTTVSHAGNLTFYEDLPDALSAVSSPESATGVWRIHFHVPVYLREFGWLRASQDDIVECMQCIGALADVDHFEVETYAWNVLPPELRQQDLALGISEELQWFAELVASTRSE